MIGELQFAFAINQCAGEWISPTRGFPQGDCLGCSAMAAVTICWDMHVRSAPSLAGLPTATSLSYADNWETVDDSPHATLVAVAATALFAEDLHMELAPAKSWLWSITKKGRITLGGVEVKGEPVPIKAYEKDLGAGVTYHGRVHVGVRDDRISKHIRNTTRIAVSGFPTGVREHQVRGAANPALLYACTPATWPPTILDRVRAATARALQPGHAGKRRKSAY